MVLGSLDSSQIGVGGEIGRLWENTNTTHQHHASGANLYGKTGELDILSVGVQADLLRLYLVLGLFESDSSNVGYIRSLAVSGVCH